MTKNLLKQIMLKPEDKVSSVDTEALISKIEEGYTVKRVAKHQQKKTFAPSTIAYGHGECARYWYLAFEGNTFEDNTDAYGAANMTSGSMSHDRIQQAMLDAGIAKEFLDDEGKPTTEFKVTNAKPPIFGWGDAILNWNDEELVTEIKTMPNDAYQYFKTAGKPKKGHVIQLLIYMKILKKAKGIMLYENKNSHELHAFVIEINDVYKNWVEYAFGWLNTVRQAWEDKTLPRKNYRANSRICKNCPLQKACATAEVGSIKIEPLEDLSEVM
jgi:CRISPR/Cas system-associated exonuclease Cas4 (RecB family)